MLFEIHAKCVFSDRSLSATELQAATYDATRSYENTYVASFTNARTSYLEKVG